jgi:hypothetical protein
MSQGNRWQRDTSKLSLNTRFVCVKEPLNQLLLTESIPRWSRILSPETSFSSQNQLRSTKGKKQAGHRSCHRKPHSVVCLCQQEGNVIDDYDLWLCLELFPHMVAGRYSRINNSRQKERNRQGIGHRSRNEEDRNCLRVYMGLFEVPCTRLAKKT